MGHADGDAMSTAIVALLCGVATALALPGSSRSRLSAVVRPPRTGLPPLSAGQESVAGGPRPAVVVVASSVCGVGVAVVVEGGIGVLLGAVAAAVTFAVLRRLEPRAARDRRERVADDLPTAVDLLGAGLAVGRPPTEALRVVGAAVGGPLAHDLAVVGGRLELGSDPVGVWREVAAQRGPLAPLGRTMARSLETGAPMAAGLRRLADDLRRRRRAARDQVARGVGVRAAAPLGLCFLPAFVLVGVVPSIVGAFASMSLW